MADGVGGTAIRLYFRRGGVQDYQSDQAGENIYSTVPKLNCAITVWLAAGDYLELMVWATGGPSDWDEWWCGIVRIGS